MRNAKVDWKIAQDFFRPGEDLLARWAADVELEVPADRRQLIGKPADIVERRSFQLVAPGGHASLGSRGFGSAADSIGARSLGFRRR